MTNKIICGDAKFVLSKIPSETIDMIITSPPYNFNRNYTDSNDDVDWDEYFDYLNAVWKECYRILKPSGRIAINVQPSFSTYTPTHHIISNQLLNIGFLWKCEILWEKHNYHSKYTSWGSFAKPSMPYLKYTWEFIEVFDKISHKKDGKRENVDITKKEFIEWVNAKWEIAPEKRMKEFTHPAMFPEELPMRLMKLFTYKGDTILDPFNGVGTTTLVAYKLKRNFIGIDISIEYCNTALKRLKDAISQKTLDMKKSIDVNLEVWNE